jgi:hypothetical protein
MAIASKIPRPPSTAKMSLSDDHLNQSTGSSKRSNKGRPVGTAVSATRDPDDVWSDKGVSASSELSITAALVEASKNVATTYLSHPFLVIAVRMIHTPAYQGHTW